MNVSAATADRQTRLLTGLVLVAGLFLAAAHIGIAFHRNLVNDDYVFLYEGWLNANGFVSGRDFAVHGYNLIPLWLSVFFRLFPHGLAALAAGRALILLVVAGIAFSVSSLAGVLFGRRPALLAPLLLLCTAPLMYRDLDIRSDLISTLIWLSLFRLLAREGFSRPRSGVLFGALLGLTLVNRWKAVTVYPAAGVGALWVMHLEGVSFRGQLTRLGWMALGFLLVLGCYLGLLEWTDSPASYVQAVMTEIGNVAGLHRFHSAESLRTMNIVSDLFLDPFFWVLALAGVVLWLCTAARRRPFPLRAEREGLRGVAEPSRHAVLAAGLLVTAFLSVALNPSYFPYNLMTLLTLLSPFAAAALGAFLDRVEKLPAPAAYAVTVLVVLSPLAGRARMFVHLATDDTLRHQLALAEFIRDDTPRDAPVLALDGVGLYRPPFLHWYMDSNLHMDYLQGGADYSAEMARLKPELVVESYRVPGWLNERDRAFLQKHFVPLAPWLLVPGYATGEEDGEDSFELLTGGRYEFLVEGEPAGCALDGATLAGGGTAELAPGVHRFSHHRAQCVVRRFYPLPARQAVADPGELPYLVPPVLAAFDADAAGRQGNAR